MASTPFHVLIVGAGSAGLTSAILLHKTLTAYSVPFQISVYELRPTPSTLGGAVNLTPNAVKILDEQIGIIEKLYQTGCKVKTMEMISSRTLLSLGNLNFGDVER